MKTIASIFLLWKVVISRANKDRPQGWDSEQGNICLQLEEKDKYSAVFSLFHCQI